MEIKHVGKRGILFTFFELENSRYDCVTNVYAIKGNQYFFICDTYLGPYFMKKVKQYLESNFGKKKYIIFNSHSHWDHIWGNSAFDNCMIIAHEKCKDLIEKNAQDELIENAERFAKENIHIVLPNITFEKKITFEEEGLEFFYSPGHTEDSASCYDYISNTLFVGDNIDNPIPSCICWNELKKYKDTLEQYSKIGADIIVQSHGDLNDKEVIRKNIAYISKLMTNEKIAFDDKDVLKKHLKNIEYLRQIGIC
ncbi:MBL fold metallo-hydrolase [Marinisporobacter balticus]|uniref:Glyoxylase-like metal-dependent hydrolase (Beta-lactamase superfamily II) n=1 Tax=Marinisporobacter balticus TaxID=2018667 RepID=A0A4R2KRL9_9FIRM|nr:MBL fold metallo-hydrolase [Marinisporobacter balticus]TCO76931.1 glyoxylase-like metal-dependent hydrolase (beta-lactamase superfamily II) [Marinisporobacter balticus]